MKKVLVLAIAVCCMMPMAHADEASKRVKAEKLVAAMHMDKVMAQMTDAIKAQMSDAMNQEIDGKSLTDKQKAIEADFQSKLVDLVMKSVGWEAMKPMFVQMYVDNFTDEEMDAMVGFYTSPVGQSVLSKMPQIMSDSMKLAQGRMVDLQPKLKALVDDYGAQMKAASN